MASVTPGALALYPHPRPESVNPAQNSTVVPNTTPIVFRALPASAPFHISAQIATQADFSDAVEYRSDRGGFEYYNGAAWISVPSTGVPTSVYSSTILGTTGLVAYWRMNDAGSPAVDSIYGLNLNFSSGGTKTTGQNGAIANDSNSSISLSSLGYLSTSSTTNMPLGNSPRTIELWFKTTQSTQGDVFGYGANATRSGFGMNIVTSSSVTTASVFTMADDLSISRLNVNDGNWHYFVGTYDGFKNLLMYWDGNLVGSKVVSTDLSTGTTYGPTIGKFFVTNVNYFTGFIDEVSVYNQALTSNQIADHYKIGKGLIGTSVRLNATLPFKALVYVRARQSK